MCRAGRGKASACLLYTSAARKKDADFPGKAELRNDIYRAVNAEALRKLCLEFGLTGIRRLSDRKQEENRRGEYVVSLSLIHIFHTVWYRGWERARSGFGHHSAGFPIRRNPGEASGKLAHHCLSVLDSLRSLLPPQWDSLPGWGKHIRNYPAEEWNRK